MFLFIYFKMLYSYHGLLKTAPKQHSKNFHLLFSHDPGRREKINLNFHFHSSLWCLKMFYEGLSVSIFWNDLFVVFYSHLFQTRRLILRIVFFTKSGSSFGHTLFWSVAEVNFRIFGPNFFVILVLATRGFKTQPKFYY